MSAESLTASCMQAIESGLYSLIVINYANPDMVGHTGNFDAAMRAVQCIDSCLGRAIEALESVNGQCLITADHGNVEQMSDPNSDQPHTAHTALKVPLIYVGPQNLSLDKRGGVLSDVAPTLIEIMELRRPKEMTGRSLLNKPDVKKLNA